MAGMNKTMLTVSNDKNLKLNFTKNGDLIYKGRFFSKVKFIYSEKATKFCEICPLLLTVCTVVKSKGKISQNFVAFSEYMNFNKYNETYFTSYYINLFSTEKSMTSFMN